MSIRCLVVVLACLLACHAQEAPSQEAKAATAKKGGKGGKKGKKKLQAQNGLVASEPAKQAATTPAVPPAGMDAPVLATANGTSATVASSATDEAVEAEVQQQLQPQPNRPRGAGAGAQRRQQRANKVSQVPPSPLTQVNAMKLTTGADYDSQPAIVETQRNETYIAYVRYSPEKKDEVVVMKVRGGNAKESMTGWKVVSGKPGQFVRPVIAAAGPDVYCFWTSTNEMQLASIWYAKNTGGEWSEAQRLLPNEIVAHQNPEVASNKDGKLAVVYQVQRGNGYGIELRQLNAGAFSEPISLHADGMDQWDPAATYDTNGKLHVTWSAYDKGDYDVYVASIEPGATAQPTARRISARGMYDMHPWLAAAPDGKVWISWDAVQIGRHGYSGRSTITGANLKDEESTGPEAEHGNRAKFSGIEVRVLDGDSVRIPGNPREEIVAPEGYKFAHRALGKIAVGSDGVPWVLYRMLVQTSPAWSDPSNAGYYWELHARAFRGGKWQPPVSFIESDGYLEEPAVFPAVNGVRVAYTSEHRRSQASNPSYVLKKDGVTTAPSAGSPAAIEEMYDHHHDFNNFLGWDGDLYMANLGKSQNEQDAPAIASLAVEEKPSDKAVDTRLTRETGRHSVTMNGEKYNLYWGDTHRHSNVSRCSVGTEPTPDDLYRYGIDINLYDFFALSDHAEHTTDFFWWKQQKTTDLYNIPGVMSVLYNYEWGMVFPNGHHNAIFTTRNNFKMNSKTGATNTCVGGWEFLSAGGYKAITAPHTSADPGMGTSWPAHDDRYQRVCEIFQACRGSYEYDGCPRQHVNATNKAGFYWKGMEKGYKMGIICSSDHGYGCAYACTYATTNTRDGIWQSIWDRRCYGSTSYGIVADVRSGNHWMGEEWSSAAAPKLSIYVRGAAPIRSVEVMGRFKTLHAAGSIEQPLNVKEFKLDWTDPEWSTLPDEQWYYVRIIQTDDEMAWTSPMWVKKP